LQDGVALSGMWVPDPDARVQASRCDTPPIEGNRVDLAEMSGQRPYTATLGYAPYPGRRVIAAGYNQIVMNRETAHTGLMPDEDIATRPRG
jgi:hypothetical protein